MKHILFLSDLKDSKDEAKIKEAFQYSNIECTISLDNHCLSVERRGDVVTSATRILEELGYHIR